MAQTLTIRHDIGAQRHVAPRRQNGRAVIAQNAVHNRHITRLDQVGGQVHIGRNHAHTRRRHEHLIRVAAPDDLGIAGDDAHARLVGLGLHAGDDAFQQCNLGALFDDERRRQPQGFRAPHGQIVDRAADRDFADVAAGKFNRINDKAVRGKGQTRARFLNGVVHQTRLILHRGGLEYRCEHMFN